MDVTEMLGLISVVLGFISVVLGFAAVAGGAIYAFYRVRVSMHQTIKELAANGASVSSEMVQMLANMGRLKPTYLRRALILIAIGFACLTVVRSFGSDLREALGIASFPGFVGIAYLILWWQTPESR